MIKKIIEQKNKNGSAGQEPLLKDLIDIGEWQKIQDSFSAIANMCIRTVDTNGLALTTPSSEPQLCKLLKKTHLKKDICETCLPTFMGGYALVDKNLSFSCKPGLHQFLVPLRLPNDKVICYIIFGPVILVMRKSKEEYREIASPDSVQLNNLYNVFLDVAVQVSGADIGSVMLLDESMKELTIRSSYGLPDEVARNTKVKLGEGISGLAAKENKLLLISERPEENRIKHYLERPYIASSMVVPIKLRDRVLGVINLAALRSSSVRFDADNAKMINKLAELTTLALQAPISK